MARKYSRKKGKSGSKRPVKREIKKWNFHSPKEVEQLVVKLAKTGKHEALIGLLLRDNYGIPDVKAITGKRIGKILKESKLEGKLPSDLQFLIKKDIMLMRHFDHNKKDMTVKRGLQLTISKINRLAKYYKKNGKLSTDWEYNRDKAKLLIE